MNKIKGLDQEVEVEVDHDPVQVLQQITEKLDFNHYIYLLLNTLLVFHDPLK